MGDPSPSDAGYRRNRAQVRGVSQGRGLVIEVRTECAKKCCEWPLETARQQVDPRNAISISTSVAVFVGVRIQ